MSEFYCCLDCGAPMADDDENSPCPECAAMERAHTNPDYARSLWNDKFRESTSLLRTMREAQTRLDQLHDDMSTLRNIIERLQEAHHG